LASADLLGQADEELEAKLGERRDRGISDSTTIPTVVHPLERQAVIVADRKGADECWVPYRSLLQ
jgi:hypothetical protein